MTHALLTAAWFGLVAMGCLSCASYLFGVLVERRRQRKREASAWESRRAARRREISGGLDGIAERVRMHMKA